MDTWHARRPAERRAVPHGNAETGLPPGAAYAAASAATGQVGPLADLASRRDGGRGLIIGALLLSSFIVALEATVISAIMPIVVSDIGGFELYTWAFSIFLLVGTVAIPLYGRLADGWGRKPLFFISMSFFVVGSLCCGLASSMPALIVFRAVQALGGAGLTPIGATMMADVTTRAERPRYMGYVSGVFGLAAIAGPVVGAWLVAGFGWRFVFWIGVPLGLAAALVIARHFRDAASAENDNRLGISSAVLLMGSIGMLILGLLEAQRLGAMQAVLLVVPGAGVPAAIFWRERNNPAAMIPVYLWRIPILRIANASAFLCGTVMMGVTIFLPVYVVGVLGAGPLIAGTMLGVMSITWTLASMTISRVMPRLRYRQVAVSASLVIVSGSMLLLAAMAERNASMVYAACGILGVGLGVHSLIFTVASQSSVAHHDRGRSTAMFYFLRRMGQTVGTAVLGGVLNFALGSSPLHYDVLAGLMQPDQRSALAAGELLARLAMLDAALWSVFLATFVFSLFTLALASLIPATLKICEAETPSDPPASAGG